MEAKALTVVTPRAFRSGESAHLKIATRNLEKLTFAAYKLDAEAYFRKKQALADVEALDIGLVAPTPSGRSEVPGYAKYKPIETTYDLEQVDGPGRLRRQGDGRGDAPGDDAGARQRPGRDRQGLARAGPGLRAGHEDRQGPAGARVLISDGSGIILEAETGHDGVLLQNWESRATRRRAGYLVLDGPHAAGSGLGRAGAGRAGPDARAYLYTDRPAYRPGQEVQLRGVVREVERGPVRQRARGRLSPGGGRQPGPADRGQGGQALGVRHVPRGVPLDEAAPVGSYRVRLYQPGKSDFSGAFEVQAYQLQKVDLTFDLPRTVYYRGETIKARRRRPLPVRHAAGRAAGRGAAARRPHPPRQDRRGGQVPVEFPTEGFAEEQALRLAAQLPQDNVAAAAAVMLAVRAFRIDLDTAATSTSTASRSRSASRRSTPWASRPART